VSTQLSVLVVEAKLFMADMIPLLEADGLRVVSVAPSELDIARFEALRSEHHPWFALTVNFSPEVAFLCSRANLPYVSWTVDPLPLGRWDLLEGTEPSNCITFSHRKSLVPTLREVGHIAAHLPLAASPRRVPAETPSAHRPLPITFVGNSLAGEEAALLGSLRPDVSAETRERLGAWLTQRDLEHGEDPHSSGVGVDQLPGWLLESTHEAEAAVADRVNGALSHRLRMRRVSALVAAGIQVWGDRGWSSLGNRFRGPAQHGAELTNIYQQSALSLDVPRIYQRDIVTMRVFDAIAAGSVIVCEPSIELAELFDVGAHVVAYRNGETLLAAVGDALLDRGFLSQMATAAQRHVNRHHRLEHRVGTLLGVVQRCTNSRPS
jgi:hypothetical protein